jgi:NADH dehydrogenase [ubiquinone] 1 alpha subcomplex assembly factor 7
MPEQEPTCLAKRIAEGISQTGPIGVDAFMARALYDPEDGYYISGNGLGADGDFITSPEISQIFGELIGLWLAQSWLDLGCPAPFHLIELGPGRGSLMADILRVGAKVDGLLPALQLHLVESSKTLRKAQAQRLNIFKPTWHSSLETVPQGPSLIVANEFLDCMPIRQFIRTDQGWREKQVGLTPHQILTFGLGPVLPHRPMCAKETDQLGSVREVAPALAPFVGELAHRFQAHQGRALFFDYCDLSDQPGDTLQALFKHTKISPLKHVGKADITAHVDFAALVDHAHQHGLKTLGPARQRDFLLTMGAQQRAQALIAANPQCANDVQTALERLIGEEHMGALFGVVCIDSPKNNGCGPPL